MFPGPAPFQFYNRYIKPMKIVIDENGDASIELGK